MSITTLFANLKDHFKEEWTLMGNIDAESKKYMSDSARFADAFNYFIYDGKHVVDPK